MKSVGGRVGVALALLVVGCAPNSRWFHAGPRPPELVGRWFDVDGATAMDTVAWVLGAGGDDRTLRVRVRRDSAGRTHVDREDRRRGSWYVKGAMSDTARRALCFKKRPRDGGTCRSFRLDTLPGDPPRRRLTVLGYPGEHDVTARIFWDRAPR